MSYKLTIEVKNKAVFDRLNYWIYDNEHAFSEDCEMGGVTDGEYIKMIPDGDTIIIELREN